MAVKHLVENVRDIALVGHRAAGKTSLADALLFEAHAVDRMGSVDDGTSVADSDEEEHRHHFSIDTHVLHADHDGKHLNILDAPGSPDFIGAALEALAAVETAVVVVSAVNGVEANTRKMFQEAGALGLSRAIVVNKLDAENVDLPSLVEGIQAALGKCCVLFNAPDRTGPGMREVYCLLDPRQHVPPTCPVDVAKARSQLVEAVIESDEPLLEKYLTEGKVTVAELEADISRAMAAGTLVPIFCLSAKKDKGVRELLDALSRYGLSPSFSRKRLEGLTVGANGSTHQLEPTEQEEFVGQVFKVVNDKFVGHLSFVRVIAGKLQHNHNVVNLRNGQTLRVGHLLEAQGKATAQVSEAGPGDIVAIAKVEGLEIGDTIAFTNHAPKLPLPHFPTPMFGVAVEPKTRGDEQKVSAGLHKLAAEDPTVKVTHDAQTHELVITGVSQLHLDVIRERLKARFGVEVNTKEPKIPYRETIVGQAEGDHKHKKQTGGRGQFAEVHLRIYPLSRDIKTQADCEAQFANKSRFEKLRSCHYDPATNFAFLDHIVGGTIPNNFIPAVEKGCKEMLERGVLAGYRVQDCAVEVHFGKYHDVDSSEAAFKTAALHAFKKAFLAARPALLEPIVKLEITVPSKYTGAILGDLPTKRAHVENQDSLPGDVTVIHARAPLGEVARYAAQLGGLTQGTGSFAMELSHYEMVPAAVQQQIVSKAKVRDAEEE
ncbi:elongation factor g : Translation elongation factor-like GTPase OS=Singulisphaera acidiphila (strain ATCC BAA-1392 / DSM 18658 / VKM B-2454 / MOB10) GN=Sinac_2640 PE=4 SV=1: GTP_EFTU: GTP_EFTU_D2: EFG_II: EFG_IV: EFG_IV: EFG_C [Gemmataceae bacterium]|nr:elongation factor g : Translation elongation factor-like GTPase OS=Singulisphaera acidiphila (strain ATCC BAA-1392 / DSM 18658 / VKM B-2454 / MOB10) GN=Sinac_2640 PE=4 SV=1: GTP_EFTU: GTP_EFTU_D2: EFG_II: EFG_IV: EFG_IV: EFG_C [Gemmataceae bacterium]VTU00371.1 elongation factor g : Translation elongation factor-like GTPase OS=Singulisphaera acidiphila (strain ATCC BAA-1392 / DSM 18658 / VKM B-2454 / MOB10) GN=Sinac_2640 PE=4 SV=1: GTP_EFTU: GTP_EFTU_D2: EFG_II: EFG_IV: EFG_IV: EFG_C [Gemmatacea